MIRDITLGQFYPGNSWVHKLDPRVKIIATLLFLIELFIVNDFLGFAIAAVVLGVFFYAEYLRKPYCYIDGVAIYDKDAAI